jgi:hypothetical protein
VALLAFTVGANADVLWDQSNVDPAVNAIVDQEFVNYPDYSSYMAMDFVSDMPWHITKMTVYLTNNNGTWAGIPNPTARFNIWDKAPYPDCTFPDGNPQDGALLPASIINGANGIEISSDLDVYTNAGQHYWINLTPHVDFTIYGQEFHQAAPIVMCNTAWRNPGGAFGYGTAWTYAYILDSTYVWEDAYDAAFLLEGYVIPAPGALALLGLAGLARRRRR